ncbi:DUF4249 domain-containing protein [Paradesertivirga mongoliensis]|uniref:DUF4249 domain-containing protein n=1 Tax=Paradesertivirga mongoliensis TaxID=2100740 RepID=A0ABW4ZG58_9SPHI|nr:DUF4249 domain-containing protein [Pedobacter mongoliensis]
MRRILFLFIGFFVLSGCEKNDPSGADDYRSKIVVEGWIEQGDYPYVILSRNIPFFATLDSAQLTDFVIRHAKVSVSDGTRTEILSSRRDTNYFPPYIYRGSELRGEAGKTYTLKIEYEGKILTASTSIPPRIALDSIWFVRKGENNDKAQLFLKFTDNPDEKNYYKLYTKTGSVKRYTPTLLSNQDDKYFNGKQLIIQANRAPVNNLTVKNDPYFEIGETVMLKFSSIPKEGYEFWSSFQDEVINSSNPLIGSTGKITSNIKGQGIGIWCGYGSSQYQVKASP